MKQNNKPLGKFKLALLMLCAILLSLTAAMSVGIFATKNSNTASAMTSSNQSQFTQVNSGNDMFNDYYNIFSVTALDDLVKKIYGNTSYKGQTKKASEFTTKNLTVNIGGLIWTPIYASTVDGDAYITFWLADCFGTSTYGNQEYIKSDIRKHLTGLGTSTVSQSTTWYGFINKFSPYIKSGTLGSYRDESNGVSDYLWLPTIDYLGTVGVNYNSSTGALQGAFNFGDGEGKFGTSVIQQTCTANGFSGGYWLQVKNRQTSGDFPTGSTSNVTKNWIYGMSSNGSTPLYMAEENKNSAQGVLTRGNYGVRPCFSLNLTRAYNGLKQDSVVHPQVTYTGNLYTSSKMPAITTTPGDTVGGITWVDTYLKSGTYKYQWKFTPHSSSYTVVTGWYTLTALAVEFDNITYTFDPGTNSVYTTTPLDTIKEYLTVTAINNDKSTKGVINSSDYELYGELVAGTNTLKLVYSGKAFDVRITGVQSSGVITYDSLEISSQPDVLTYSAFDKFNQTGMKVKAVYSNGTKKDVTDYVIEYPDYDGNPSTCFHYGDTKVTVRYTDTNGDTQSVDVAVTVNKKASTVNPQVTVTDTLYTSSTMPVPTNATSGTSGTFTWDTVNGDPAKLIAGTNDYSWTFTPTDTDNYTTVTGTYKLTATEVALESISATYVQEVDTDGNPVTIYTSTKLENIKTITVIGTNNDGSLYTQFNADGSIPSTEYVLSGAIKGGTNVITVTYGGKVATFNVTGVEVAVDHVEAKYGTNASKIYASFKTEQLKAELEVKVVYNDGTEKALDAYEYELVNNLSDATNPQLVVKYKGEECAFLPTNFEATVTVDRIEAEFNATDIIYETASTDGINALKKYLKIKLYYSDGSDNTLPASDLTGLTLSGRLDATEGDSAVTTNIITASYALGNNRFTTTTFEVDDVKEEKLTGLQVTFVRPTDGITTKTKLSSLKNSTCLTQITAVYASGKKVTVNDLTTITLIGTLTAGTDCKIAVRYTDAASGEEATVSVSVGEVTLIKDAPTVTPQINLTDNTVLVEGVLLSQIAITTSEGDTLGTIKWKQVDDGNGTLVDAKLISGKHAYEWEFVPDATLQATVNGTSGKYYFTAEAKSVKSLEIEIKTGETIYPETGKDILKSRFKVVAVYNDNSKVELAVDDYDVYANLKANETCDVVFSFTDESGKIVTGTKGIFVATLTGALPVAVRWNEEEPAYEFTGKGQKPSAYFTTASNDKVILDVKVFKRINGVWEEVEEAVSVGSYKAVAQNPASGNYAITGGTELAFTISPKNIVRPVALSGSDYKYTGSELEFLLDGFNADIMTVTGNKQTEAGSYTVTVELTDDNYKFAVGDGTASTLSYAFNIVKPEEVGTTTVTVQGTGVSTGLLIGVIVAMVIVLVIATVAIIIALKSNKPTGDNDGFYDTVDLEQQY